MTVTIRPTEPHEYRQAQGAMAIPLLNAPLGDDDWSRSAPSWDEMISFSAWEDGRCLGHAGQFPVETVVPGGDLLATGAVSRVGVMPTARRRGIATELMHRLVFDAVERAKVLMSLRASEATIYGRFGFGVAGDIGDARLDPSRALPIRGAAESGGFRLLAPDEIIDTIGPLYERCLHRRVGAVTRPPSWTERYARSAIERSAASFVVVHHDTDGRDDGYARYQLKWSDGANHELIDGGIGTVHDLWAVDDAAELALWTFVLGLDLVRSWHLVDRPTDDLIRSAIADRRALQWKWVDDEQWLRLIDVDVALSARSYRPAVGSVTISVADPLLDGNNGTWRIDAEGAQRVDGEPDLQVDIAGLSAAYLGGVSWDRLVAVGEATARTAAAVELADTLMGIPRAPHSGSFF